MARGTLGAQLFTCRAFCKTIEGVAETFRKVARIGYSSVQVSGFGPVDPNDVALAARDAGVTIAATHVGWDRFLGELDDVIETHKLWGCNHPAIGGLPREYHNAGSGGVKRFIEELTPVAQKLAAEGMDFSYHNHAHELVKYGDDDKPWLEILYDRAPAEILKAEIDTHWIVAGGGDPAQWVRDCAGREPLLHLKDFAMDAEDGRRFAEIGEGNLNWAAILSAAEEGGVEHYLVEQDDCYGRDPFESLAISYRNLAAMGLE